MAKNNSFQLLPPFFPASSLLPPKQVPPKMPFSRWKFLLRDDKFPLFTCCCTHIVSIFSRIHDRFETRSKKHKVTLGESSRFGRGGLEKLSVPTMNLEFTRESSFCECSNLAADEFPPWVQFRLRLCPWRTRFQCRESWLPVFFAAVVTVIVAGGDAAVPRGKLTRVVAHTHSKIGRNNIDFSLLLVDEDF